MNRLAATVLPNGQIHTSTYRFDHLRYSHVSPTEGTEQFIWDHQKPDGLRDMLARIGTGGGTTHLEVHGENLARYMGLRGDGAPLNWMLQEDAQQSVQSNAGIYGGVPASDGRFKTDAFGNNYAADLYGQPYEFGGGLGYWYDPDLALHYIRERRYDPKTGTWLSVDPVCPNQSIAMSTRCRLMRIGRYAFIYSVKGTICCGQLIPFCSKAERVDYPNLRRS